MGQAPQVASMGPTDPRAYRVGEIDHHEQSNRLVEGLGLEVQAVMSIEEIFEYLRSIVTADRDVDVHEFFNGRELILEFQGRRVAGRRAAVRSPGSRWFSVELEELYDYTFVDEDADDDEVRNYLLTCVRVAEAYVREGGVEERRGLFRSRSVTVDLGGSCFRLQKIIGRRAPR